MFENGFTQVFESLMKNLEVGPCVKLGLMAEKGVVPQIGRLLEYNPVTKKYKQFTGFDPSYRVPIVIFADPLHHSEDAVALDADTQVTCIIQGDVNPAALIYTVPVGTFAIGPVDTETLPIAAGVDPALGQVVEYDKANDNWKAFTVYADSGKYAIFFDRNLADPGNALGAPTDAVCIIGGQVNLAALDATAQADGDIKAGLLGSGITPVSLTTEDEPDVKAALLPVIVCKKTVLA